MNWRNIVKVDKPEAEEEDEFDPSGATHGRVEQKPKSKKPAKGALDFDNEDDDRDGMFTPKKEPKSSNQPPGSCDNHPGCLDQAFYFCSDCCTKYCAECYEDFGGTGSGGRGHPKVVMAGDESKRRTGYDRYDGTPHTEWCHKDAVEGRERRKRGL